MVVETRCAMSISKYQVFLKTVSCGSFSKAAEAMVSEGLGISLLPELMVRHSPTPIKVCHAPLHFYRTIGIGVKDKKALSNSTRLIADYVRTWVAENGEA